MNTKRSVTISIGQLYPELTPEEAKRAEENLESYLGLVIRVYRRISQDPVQLAALRAALYENDAANTPETAELLTEGEA